MNPKYDWLVAVDCTGLNKDDCWNCPSCAELHATNFGARYIIDSPETQSDCANEVLRGLPHMALFTSTASDCALFEKECERDYYAASTTECVPCLEPGAFSFSCGFGYHLKRCSRQTDAWTRDDLCLPCTFPPLPTTQVNGLAMFQYGTGQLYDDCNLLKGVIKDFASVNRTTCALFQTPKWTKGWCGIQCAEGFVPLTAPGAMVIGALPTCKPCKTYCPGGSMAPTCRGGSLPQMQQDGECIQCEVPLPPNAMWTTECNWAPAPGYFYEQVFAPILACSPLSCAASAFYYMGCHDTSPGRCVDCSSTMTACAGSASYVHAAIHMDQCACEPCDVAVAGATYYAQNCSLMANAQVRPCTPSCPLNHFISKACGLYSDLQCTACKPVQLNQYLVLACTERDDAVYYPCPVNMGCNGSKYPFQCPSDKKPLGGACVCKEGMSMIEGNICRPYSCAPGYYPDAITDACQQCADSDSADAVTVAGVMGLSACVCPPAHFVLPKAFSTQRVHCWPCGDLECDLRVQRQTPCSGLTAQEPRCVCALGPGMEALNFSFMQPLCAARCAAGYETTANGVLAPALRDRFDFLGPLPALTLFDSPSTPALVAVLDLSTIMVVPASNRKTIMLSTLQKGAVAFPTERVLIVGYGNRLSLLEIHALLAHDAYYSFVWVVFRFRGICEGYTLDDGMGVCWTIQLLQLVTSQSATSPECIPSLSQCVFVRPHAIDFAPTAEISAINSVASGAGGRTLLVVWNDTRISSYPVQALTSDLPGPPTLLHVAPSAVVAVVESMGGIVYALLQTGDLLRLPDSGFSVEPLKQIVAFPPGGRLVMGQLLASDEWIQIDVLNRLASPPFASGSAAAFQRGTIMALWNGTKLLHHHGVRVCPLDTYNPHAPEACEFMPCVLSSPCGPHSVRAFGSVSCSCVPGYYVVSEACLPCGSANAFSYCPGHSEPVLCPSQASTAHTPTASSIADCLCPPRTYHFDSQCIPCPPGFFCPSNGTLVPVQCVGGGMTKYFEGSESPLDCQCSSRAYGLTCTPCDDYLDCTRPYDAEKRLILLFAIRGWGPAWGLTQLETCLASVFSKFLHYSIVGITATREAMTVDRMYWNWLVLGHHLSTPDDDLTNNISDCLNANLFVDLSVEPRGSVWDYVFEPQAYGSHWEWNGDYETPQAICIAGYEELSIEALGLGTHCFPCLNGTIRARRAQSPLCAPCTEPNSHAPYLGMTACSCLPGYVRAEDVCVPADDTLFLPWWHTSSPLIPSIGVAVFGALVIMFSILLVWCL